MDLKKLDAKRDVMLRELALYVPEWSEEETILLRMVAARLLNENGIPREVAMTVNTVVKQALTLGYSLREYELRNGIDRTFGDSSTFFMDTCPVRAA